MDNLNLYGIFYLNLMFSSIGVEDRITVIKKCYWPLLGLIEKGFRIGVQPSGTTLEIIKDLDSAWIEKFKELLKERKCELIGDGYSHIIGPLVPAEVNKYNHILGLQTYKDVLRERPRIAAVTENAYSSGLIEYFIESGYKAIIMDWNNPAQFHPEWKKEWRYHPQIALGNTAKKIPVIWSNCIAFQKFQRYVNGVLELDEYLAYIRSQKPQKGERFYMLYGSDTEIFDFRTRRYASKIEGRAVKGEWGKISKLFEALSREENIRIILPSEVLDLEKDRKHSFKEIRLESPEDPIPVKKQEKYNITRWGLSGNSIDINTKCYQVYNNLRELAKNRLKNETDPLWKELCFLWASDFRTHIEKKRLEEFRSRLSRMLKKTENSPALPLLKPVKKEKFIFKRSGGRLSVESSGIKIVFNLSKGLVIDSMVFKKVSVEPLLGELPHGYFDDIRLGADFFSCHTVIGIPGKSQMTDLIDVRPKIFYKQNNLVISCKMPFLVSARHQVSRGFIEKTITIFSHKNEVELDYLFHLMIPDPVSWRTGFITLKPEAFDGDSLYFACHNGGKNIERFSLRNVNSIDKDPVSLMVSAPSALGNTAGLLELGDAKKKILIETDMSQCASLPMIHFRRLPGTFFLRSFYSLGEIDDTTFAQVTGKEIYKAHFSMTISAKKITDDNNKAYL